MSDQKELLEKIKGIGHWRVLLRPTQFEPQRVATLGEGWNLVEANRVSLRGWDYPHVELEGKSQGNDWIGSGIDWEAYGHIELWRLYQSGQFVHYFACIEDYHKLSRQSSEGTPDHYLLWVNTLFLMTEIFEFATRLAAKSLFEPGVDISIKLAKTEGRELTYDRFQDHLRRGYKATHTDIRFERTYGAGALLTGGRELAVEAAIHFLERFGWLSPPRDALSDRQRQFVEKRSWW